MTAPTAFVIDAAVIEPIVLRERNRQSGIQSVFVGLHGSRARWPFDEGILLHSDHLESVLDHAFAMSQVGENDLQRLVITEPVCTPPLSRGVAAELLFELYEVPAVAFGVDSLFAFHEHVADTATSADDAVQDPASTSGLAVSISHSATHLVPVLDGAPQMQWAKRISVGCNKLKWYMKQLMHLKYPDFPHVLSDLDYQRFVRKHCYVAENYPTELFRLVHQDHDIVVQYRITQHVNQPVILERVQLTPQEEYRLAHDKAKWLTELAEEKAKLEAKLYRTGGGAGETGNAVAGTSSSRKKSETQSRMRVMASLLDGDDDEGEGGKPGAAGGGRGGAGAAARRKRQKKQDRFGDDSADWKVYSSLSKEPDDDQDPQLIAQLSRIDKLLTEHDPLRHVRFYQRAHAPPTLLPRLLYGPTSMATEADILAREHQIRLNVERIRVPEALFHPPLAGVDEAGLAELAQTVLAGMPNEEDRKRVRANVVVVGGGAAMPGIAERLRDELVREAPVGSVVSVETAREKVVGAWRGAARFVDQVEYVSREAYMEAGGDGTRWFRSHLWSNRG
ncbi:Nuclear actin-protein involved in chromatin remodeling [Allomyces arbusculus]|nr:Nuclear actin-protein involved in chromatin remodeling [Allomyces arbusculus]